MHTGKRGDETAGSHLDDRILSRDMTSYMEILIERWCEEAQSRKS